MNPYQPRQCGTKLPKSTCTEEFRGFPIYSRPSIFPNVLLMSVFINTPYFISAFDDRSFESFLYLPSILSDEDFRISSRGKQPEKDILRTVCYGSKFWWWLQLSLSQGVIWIPFILRTDRNILDSFVGNSTVGMQT